jgi:hypothetical protein
MADETGRTKDFTKGIAAHEVGDGVIVGLLVGDTVRCPWHHACFSLRTGEPVRAPSLDPVDCWRIEQQGDMLFVRQKLEAAPKSSSSRDRSLWPVSVVIIGGGAAGLGRLMSFAAKVTIAPIAILSADDPPALRSPELIEGLSGRHRPGRLDSSSGARVYPGHFLRMGCWSPPSVSLEKLDGAFVLLGCPSRAERAQISPFSSSWIDLARVQPVLTRLELANHRNLYASLMR